MQDHRGAVRGRRLRKALRGRLKQSWDDREWAFQAEGLPEQEQGARGQKIVEHLAAWGGWDVEVAVTAKAREARRGQTGGP